MYRLHTLGGLTLRDEAGERVEALAGRTLPLALLAYMAVEGAGERIAREELVGLFWADRSEERARTALRSALYRLREATDPPVVGGKGEQAVGADPDRLRVDVHAFREAVEAEDHVRALELHEGPFLAGVHVSDARRFERWIDRRRDELRQQAYEAALALGRAARGEGDLAAAEAAFRRARELAPLREEPARALIRTLAERGRPADAVQLFEAFRERREEELELSPSDELADEVRTIKEAPPSGEASTAGPTTRRESDEKAPSDGRAAAEAPGTSREATDQERRAWRGPTGAMVVLLLAAVVGAGWALLAGDDDVRPLENSVAVLPFETVGTVDPDPVAEGLHSDLLTRLSEVGELEVISATSVERFREADLPLPVIADSLGVRWVVEGTVQQAGDVIEIDAQLIDPRTDTHAWAETYRRQLNAQNLFELQGSIVRRIAAALEAALGQEERARLARRSTGSLRAHRFYIRGRSLLEQRQPPQMRKALAYFDQALAVDSGYALAWAGRANGLALLARFPAPDADTLLPRADSAVERALALQPGLAEARLARGRLHMYRRQGPAALAEMRRAVELKPSYAAAHAWLAKLGMSLGHPAEALPAARRSVELDPMSTENLGTLCWALIANGRIERALEIAGRVEQLQSGESFPLYRILALAQRRRLAELETIANQVEGDLPDWARPPFWVAIHRPAAGDTATAREALMHHEGRPTAQIMLHGALGHTDRAFELLHESYPRPERVWDVGFAVYLRYFWPAGYGPIRADPRFETFLAEMNRNWGLNPDGSLPDSVGVSFGEDAGA